MFIQTLIGVTVLTFTQLALLLEAAAKTHPTQIMKATGTLKITLTPKTDEGFESGRMTIDKVYTGELEGIGKGQMLSVRTAVPGSASYIALESVKGTLNGHTGSFTLQHSGSMVRGESSLQVNIVNDSGTGDFKGISGTMNIEKTENTHNYTLSYSLPAPKD